ncbi:hypothetical protein OIO90_003908 [Microbotryomycetes sp. JL221]|nr:hypothetical protein OIO90_003908 [Microbotryomycetes sp. JL221]
MPRTIQLPTTRTNAGNNGNDLFATSPFATLCCSAPRGVSKRLIALFVVCLIVIVGLSRTSPLPTAPGFHHQQQQQQADVKQGSTHQDKHDTNHQSSSTTTTMAKAILANGGQPTLTEFLDAHFPQSQDQDDAGYHVWLTLSDGHWMTTGTHALHTFTTRLNSERRAQYKQTKTTALVALCIDEQCVRNAQDRGMYAYGGYQFTRPDKSHNLAQTRCDPYPHMEQFMKSFDVVAQENDAFDHFNTGWIWMRKSQTTSDAWHKVLEMDLNDVSRDQNNFNKVLGTTELRHCDPTNCIEPNSQYPLKDEFTSLNGLKVKILDPRVFRSFHFEADLPSAMRHDSVSLHMTCGDDAFVKTYVAKTQGFWGNVRGYYEDPPKLITIDHLIGSRKELTQMVKIALMAAHYTGRAFLPPSFASFTDLAPFDSNQEPTTSSRRAYSAFPFSHVEQFLDVKVVEPEYDRHSSDYLVGNSVLGGGKIRTDQGWLPGKTVEDRIKLALSLSDVAELDMRQVDSFDGLYSLLTSSTLSHHQQIKLVHFDIDMKPSTLDWIDWPTSNRLKHFKECEKIQDRPSCDSLCRFKDPSKKIIETDDLNWESLENVLKQSKQDLKLRKEKQQQQQQIEQSKQRKFDSQRIDQSRHDKLDKSNKQDEFESTNDDNEQDVNDEEDSFKIEQDSIDNIDQDEKRIPMAQVNKVNKPVVARPPADVAAGINKRPPPANQRLGGARPVNQFAKGQKVNDRNKLGWALNDRSQQDDDDEALIERF